MRRLAIFWLACAAVGFLAAVGGVFVLSLALDGAGAWRGAIRPGRVVERRTPSSAANTASPLLAPALGHR